MTELVLCTQAKSREREEAGKKIAEQLKQRYAEEEKSEFFFPKIVILRSRCGITFILNLCRQF